MRDPELSWDVAGSDPVVGQLDDPLPDDVGKRSTVDEDAPQLIHTAVTYNEKDLKIDSFGWITNKAQSKTLL